MFKNILALITAIVICVSTYAAGVNPFSDNTIATATKAETSVTQKLSSNSAAISSTVTAPVTSAEATLVPTFATLQPKTAEPTAIATSTPGATPAATNKTETVVTSTTTVSASSPKVMATTNATSVQTVAPTAVPTAAPTAKPVVLTPAPALPVTPAIPAIADNGQPQIYLDNLSRGTVSVRFTHAASVLIKVIIQKDSTKYTYNLVSTTGFETFPLQLGNGAYTVKVYENIGGTSYKESASWDVSLNVSNSLSIYLNSIQLINYSVSTNAVDKARQVVAGLSSNEEKANAVYNYLITNMKYDVAKASSLPTNYIPNISGVFSSKSGICYDFSSTFAAMLRGLNIPTKLVMGTCSNVSGYHAWNEVYLNGGWVTVDTSYDSQMKAAGQATTMASKNSYVKTKEY